MRRRRDATQDKAPPPSEPSAANGNAAEPSDRDRAWGPWFMVGSAAAFATVGVLVKFCSPEIPVLNLVCWRAIFSLVMSYFALSRVGVSVWGQRKGLLLLRGVLGAGGLVCVFGALSRLPIAEATVFQFLHPTFSAVLAPLLIRERSDKRVLLAVALGFMGVVTMSFGPSLGSAGAQLSLPADGIALAIGGAFCSSLAYLCVRVLSRTEHPLVVVFYFPLVTLPGILPFALMDWVWPTGIQWLWIVGIGVFTQIAQVWLTRGFSLMQVSRASVFSYVQVPIATLWGWIAFAALPSLATALGALAIVSGALLASRARNA